MIRKFEEISMNAFPPGIVTYYDGWILRMSPGPSKRLNSVNMLYQSSCDIEEKIQYCESFYQKKGFRKVFKITDLTQSVVIDKLSQKGYQETGHTHVQLVKLEEGTIDHQIIISESLDEAWLNAYCLCGKKDPAIYQTAWGHLIQDLVFVSIKINDRLIGFGMGVIEQDTIGIFGIRVDSDYRQQGYGQQLTKGIMAYGHRRGCSSAYLQVERHNESAKKLYNKIGFTTMYDYYYLVKDDQ